MDVETMTTLGGLAAAMIGSGGLGSYLTARSKARAKEREAKAKEREAEATVERSRVIAAERVEVATIQADVTMSKSLLESMRALEASTDARIKAIEAETERCHEERRQDKEQRRKDREACDRKIAALQRRIDNAESDLGTVAGRVYEARAAALRLSHPGSDRPPPGEEWADDTGLHELEAIRTRTPTGPIRPVPPRRRTRADNVAAKKETP